jgi:poly-beta-hydroxyalkanoate depolymerase
MVLRRDVWLPLCVAFAICERQQRRASKPSWNVVTVPKGSAAQTPVLKVSKEPTMAQATQWKDWKVEHPILDPLALQSVILSGIYTTVRATLFISIE